MSSGPGERAAAPGGRSPLAHPILRPAGPGDEGFLFDLYASTRRAEIEAWGWPEPQQQAFLRMQYDAQSRHLQGRTDAAGHQVIVLDGRPSGRLVVARSAAEIQLLDIMLLPEAQNAGVGSALIRELLEEGAAHGVPVTLSVLRDNRAARLYERLGFRVTGDDGMYVWMEARPAT